MSDREKELPIIRCGSGWAWEVCFLGCVIGSFPYQQPGEMEAKDFRNNFESALLRWVDAYAMGKVREALEIVNVILPMAKGFAAQNPVGRNVEIVKWAEEKSAKLSSGEVKSNG